MWCSEATEVTRSKLPDSSGRSRKSPQRYSTFADPARERATAMLCSSLSTPVTCGTAMLSLRVSSPVPQPTSSALSQRPGIASMTTGW